MINDDTLIKYSIRNNYGGLGDWVSHVKVLAKGIRKIRDKDFMGIGLGDLSLISPGDIKAGSRVILSEELYGNQDNGGASVLGLVLRVSPKDPMVIEMEVEGLGSRPDLHRDPKRLLRWGEKIYPDLHEYPVLLEMTTKPRSDGGAVYYYYNKSPRDQRVNYVPGFPQESREAILGTLWNTAQEDLSGVRGRAQYLHTYRRVWREIEGLIRETGRGDNLLVDLQGIIQGATGERSKEISMKVWEKLRGDRN